jgi:hypothetical protein
MGVQEQTIQLRFLLGKLPEAEQAQVELEFLTDKRAFDELLIAENSLLDAYVIGTLQGDDRRAFEARLLRTNRQKARAAFADALIRHANHKAAEAPAGVAARSSAELFTWLTQFFSNPFTLNFAAAAACLVLVLGAVVWVTSLQSRQTAGPEVAVQTSPEPAAISQDQEPPSTPGIDPAGNADAPETNARPAQKRAAEPKPLHSVPAPKPVESVIATFMLPLTSTRGGGGTEFVIPRNAGVVRLQAPAGDEPRKHYFALVETVDGQQIWRGRVRPTKNSGTISVSLPSRLLKAGDYIVTLKGSDTADNFETVGEYAFTVTRR